jgi:hypothetical protein
MDGHVVHRRGARAVVVLAVVAAAGCAGPAAPPGGSRPALTAGANARQPDRDAGPPSFAYPSADAASRRAALDAATTTVTAFARPGETPAAWWAGLSPLLSPAGAVAYLGTDPAEIPAHEVTGPASVGASPSAFLATVFVPTDAGEYAVLLVRADAGAPWLAERIEPVGRPAAPDASPGGMSP